MRTFCSRARPMPKLTAPWLGLGCGGCVKARRDGSRSPGTPALDVTMITPRMPGSWKKQK